MEEERQEPRDTSGWILGFPGRVWAVIALILVAAVAAGGVPTLVNPNKGWMGYAMPIVLLWLFCTGVAEGLDERRIRELEAKRARRLEWAKRTSGPPPASEPPAVPEPVESSPAETDSGQPEEDPEVIEERRAMQAAVQQHLARRVEAGEFL